MDMTLEQYILNPMGKSNAVLNASVRETIRRDYMNRFDTILLRENGRVEYYLYKDEKSNTYWAHIKVPSEAVKKFYYDVVFKFYADEKIKGFGDDLLKYKVNFFSNDPAFVFTYAHVFIRNNIFIKELSPRMSKEAIRKAPKEKNSTHDVGYVKAIYFAYLLIRNKKLSKKARFEAEAINFDLARLLSSIEDADSKISKRQEEGKHISHKKKIRLDEKTAKNFMRHLNQDDGTGRIQVATTKRVSSIKSINGINSTKKVGRTKKI
jgi:hypothetical protein